MEFGHKRINIKKSAGDMAAKVGAGILFVVISFLLGNAMILCFMPSLILFTGSVPVWNPELMYGAAFFVGVLLFGSIIVVSRKMNE